MKRDIISSALGILLATLLLGIAYPLLLTGVSQVAFPTNANGQQVHVAGRLVGSRLIGQSFEQQVMRDGKSALAPDPRYFQTRPSATVPVDNAAGSAFSNLGPNSVATEQEIAGNIRAYLALEGRYDPGLNAAQVPVDAADSSASGIDPDISVANADIQAHRVAVVRHLTPARVQALIARSTGARGLGFSGEPTVNVLELNLALDRITGGR